MADFVLILNFQCSLQIFTVTMQDQILQIWRITNQIIFCETHCTILPNILGHSVKGKTVFLHTGCIKKCYNVVWLNISVYMKARKMEIGNPPVYFEYRTAIVQ